MSETRAHRDGADAPCRRSVSEDRRKRAASALGAVTGYEAVELSIDGCPMVAAFELHGDEVSRRRAYGVGPITSTALLHGLWMLPRGIPVPMAAVPDQKRDRLAAATNLVSMADGQFVREYEPPGTVRAVAFAGASLTASLRRAARFTPIVQRFVCADGPARPTPGTVSIASEHGVGLVEMTDGRSRVIQPASPPQLGVPAVYRWWIAELAYSSWLYENTQPVS